MQGNKGSFSVRAGPVRNKKEFDKWREKEGIQKWNAFQVNAPSQKGAQDVLKTDLPD